MYNVQLFLQEMTNNARLHLVSATLHRLSTISMEQDNRIGDTKAHFTLGVETKGRGKSRDPLG